MADSGRSDFGEGQPVEGAGRDRSGHEEENGDLKSERWEEPPGEARGMELEDCLGVCLTREGEDSYYAIARFIEIF
jgi:hypothetical protein